MKYFCWEISVVVCYYFFFYLFFVCFNFFFVFCMCLCYNFLWLICIFVSCYLIKNEINITKKKQKKKIHNSLDSSRPYGRLRKSKHKGLLGIISACWKWFQNLLCGEFHKLAEKLNFLISRALFLSEVHILQRWYLTTRLLLERY